MNNFIFELLDILKKEKFPKKKFFHHHYKNVYNSKNIQDGKIL